MKLLLAFVSALALCSCQGAKYALDNYSKVDVVTWTSPTTDKTFRIYDKPAENRMMMVPGFGAIMAQGMTYGAVKRSDEEFRSASIEWLALQGRACTVTGSHLIIEPQHEVRYTCSAPATSPS